MSYQRLTSLPTKQEQDAHEKKWGGYNSAPPGFKEITAEEFAVSGYFTWCIEGVETRQVNTSHLAKDAFIGKNPGWLAITMFFMNHGECYATAQDYSNKQVRYFKFADCYHEYRGMTDAELSERKIKLFRCDHANICAKCGYVWVYNSGD